MDAFLAQALAVMCSIAHRSVHGQPRSTLLDFSYQRCTRHVSSPVWNGSPETRQDPRTARQSVDRIAGSIQLDVDPASDPTLPIIHTGLHLFLLFLPNRRNSRCKYETDLVNNAVPNMHPSYPFTPSFQTPSPRSHLPQSDPSRSTSKPAPHYHQPRRLIYSAYLLMVPTYVPSVG